MNTIITETILIKNINESSKDKSISLMINSSDKIEYQLFEIEYTDNEMCYNNPNLNMENLKKIGEYNEYNYKFLWKDDLYLIITNNSYCIYENNIFISGFTDKYSIFQLGDGETNIYLDLNNNLVIENNGDVSSIVKINLI